MGPLHPLLKRQLRDLLSEVDGSPPEVRTLIARVDEAYRQFDADRVLLERSLELSSQELLEANAEMRLVIQALPDLFLRLELDGTITSCRARSHEDLIDAPERMVGRRIQDLPATAARQAFTEALARMAGGAPSATIEYMLQVRGSDQTYEARLMPLCAGQLLGVVRNITARRRTEAELVRAREMALETATMKSQFLANMSHEIRTPMTCIIGMTELALDTSLDSQQREFIGAIKTAADSLLELLNDILDFSKIEAGRLTLETIPFGLRDCVGSALKSLALRASQKRLELACQVDPEIPERLMGDPGRLRQVILNLVGNGIKFTERGEVVVRIHRGQEREDSIELRFDVRDSGIGIPLDKQRSIFDAFTQADGSTTRRFGGTGLGLAICSQLAQLMRGAIAVESEPGCGSTFSFNAWFGLEPSTAATARPAPPSILRDVRVLIIDDNEANRLILSSLVGRWGARPEVVPDGSQGLVALERAAATGQAFGLVLLDVQMPDMDGMTVAREIRERLKLAVPIIVLTSMGAAGDAAECRRLGVSGYLTKPVMGDELLQAIRSVLGGLAAGAVGSLVTRHSLQEERSRFHLLLAEDNSMNRQVITRLLEKRGHHVEAVENGLQVLAALEVRAFDLILMDVQMPELDGLEATRVIREAERGTTRHIPIVALTAHAMKGDRERCLDSGMDGYATKPIDARELLELIESLTSSREQAAEPASSEVFDLAEAIRLLDNDRSLLEEAVRLHGEETPRAVAAIRAALTGNDPEALRRAAHRLKGGLATLGARSAAAAAARLEALASAQDRGVWTTAVDSLEHELARLTEALAELPKAA